MISPEFTDRHNCLLPNTEVQLLASRRLEPEIMRLTFDADKALMLLRVSKCATLRHAVFNQMCNPLFWREDMPEKRRQELLAYVRENPRNVPITTDDIDRCKIPRGLQLVGNHGICLMTNVSIALANAKLGFHRIYAEEASPAVLSAQDLWAIKSEVFEQHGGAIFLSSEALEPALNGKQTQLIIILDKVAGRILDVRSL